VVPLAVGARALMTHFPVKKTKRRKEEKKKKRKRKKRKKKEEISLIHCSSLLSNFASSCSTLLNLFY
jgi:hypothetical protein